MSDWSPPAYMDRNANGSYWCNRCKHIVILFDDDTHEGCVSRETRNGPLEGLDADERWYVLHDGWVN